MEHGNKNIAPKDVRHTDGRLRYVSWYMVVKCAFWATKTEECSSRYDLKCRNSPKVGLRKVLALEKGLCLSLSVFQCLPHNFSHGNDKPIICASGIDLDCKPEPPFYLSIHYLHCSYSVGCSFFSAGCMHFPPFSFSIFGSRAGWWIFFFFHARTFDICSQPHPMHLPHSYRYQHISANFFRTLCCPTSSRHLLVRARGFPSACPSVRSRLEQFFLECFFFCGPFEESHSVRFQHRPARSNFLATRRLDKSFPSLFTELTA